VKCPELRRTKQLLII